MKKDFLKTLTQNIYDNDNNDNVDDMNKNDPDESNSNNNLGWCAAEDSFISWGKGSSLALVGNPSRDDVLIKILEWRHFKPTPQFMSD